MLKLFLLLAWLVIWLLSIIVIMKWLLFKSQEKIREAIQAYREVKKSKQDIEDLFKEGKK